MPSKYDTVKFVVEADQVMHVMRMFLFINRDKDLLWKHLSWTRNYRRYNRSKNDNIQCRIKRGEMRSRSSSDHLSL